MTNPVDRLAAALSDRYRIERELGAGGMATVYLAHDLKHDRNVALKVLRPELAAVIGAERFLAEIKTTANLQHPHILPLHDSGEVNGTVFYVMPYVEGESLRDRLSRERQLPIDDALRITTQVAGALDYAHRHGVIHRDIKPENILLHDGQALVADFGIALAAATTAGNRLTETGMSLGTPTYMSPEQAMGERHIDARSDVYALACVLYEMLTGDPPFTGSSAQAIVAKVLTEKPASVRKFRDTVPPTVDAALMAALAKLPADRFEGTAQFAAALADRGAPSVGAYVEPGRRDPYARIFWPALAGVFLVAAILAWFAGRLGSTSAPAPGVVFTFATPATAELAPLSRSTELGRVALSPDGTMLVYAGLGSDTGQVVRGLFRRRLDGLGVTAIPGTDSAAVPMFSPDGSWIAYYTGQRLVRIPATGGAATTIADSLPGLEGAAWLSADSIVFARAGRLWLVGADGGAIRRVSRDSLPDTSQPLAVAGGKDVVFFACDTNPCEAAPVMVLNVATGRSRVLVPDVDVDVVRELGPDVLTLVRDNGSVQGIRYDPSTMRVQGKPVVLPAPAPADVMRDADFDLSPTGVAAVAPSADEAGGDLVWVDRAGHVAPVLGRAQKYLFPRVSPDGRKIAMEIHDATDNGYIWVYDVQSQTFTRITDRGHSTRPAWSTDGKQLAYVSLRGDSTGIYVSSADL
ncbi:MAG: protein kinase domain-containing protein, partial [Gemmatimonadaceae bacterium]